MSCEFCGKHPAMGQTPIHPGDGSVSGTFRVCESCAREFLRRGAVVVDLYGRFFPADDPLFSPAP